MSELTIQKGRVVQFHYQVSEKGNVLEDNHDSTPSLYLHGYNNILPVLEKQFEGKKVGDVLSAHVKALEGYGPHKPDQIQKIPVKILKGKKRFKAGDIGYIETKEGPRQLKVVKMGLKFATVDANHPYAGKDLDFEIKIADVREATEDEIAHGHAHGVGGHQHD